MHYLSVSACDTWPSAANQWQDRNELFWKVEKTFHLAIKSSFTFYLSTLSYNVDAPQSPRWNAARVWLCPARVRWLPWRRRLYMTFRGLPNYDTERRPRHHRPRIPRSGSCRGAVTSRPASDRGIRHAHEDMPPTRRQASTARGHCTTGVAQRTVTIETLPVSRGANVSEWRFTDDGKTRAVDRHDDVTVFDGRGSEYVRLAGACRVTQWRHADDCRQFRSMLMIWFALFHTWMNENTRMMAVIDE